MGQKAKFGIKKREKGINVTPFVDVLLVVLVIFILTSNASIPGIEVNLPKASNSVALEKPKTKAITIDPSGQVFLDAYPVTMAELEDRLRTRFEWGLTADVQPPDFETRVASVKRKAELLHLDLPEDVAEFIANHLKNNIRQLEGAVKKLNAYYMLEGIQPVISVAQNAIKDILNETQPVPVTIEKIVGEVSRTFNVSPADIRGTKRNANVASARRVAIYILREVTGMSMEEIGREFSGRDHSTIVYSLKTMERDMKNDQHLRETVSDIIKNIRDR